MTKREFQYDVRLILMSSRSILADERRWLRELKQHDPTLAAIESEYHTKLVAYLESRLERGFNE